MEEKKRGKPVLSLLGLLPGASIYKIFAVLAVMGVMEGALFVISVQRGSNLLENTLYNRQIYPVFIVALGLVFFLLIRVQSIMGEKGEETLRRLKLSGMGIFLIEVCYNLACLILIFAVQIWILIITVKIYGVSDVPQGLFLTCYHIELLHNLLPMAEAGKWVRNLLLFLAFSFGAACGFGEKDYMLPALVFLGTAIWFVSPVGSNLKDLICNTLYALGIASGVLRAWELRDR